MRRMDLTRRTSDRRQASAERSEAMTHRVYSAIFDLVPEAVAVLDLHGRYLEMNEAHTALVTTVERGERQTPARYLGREVFHEMMRELATTRTFRRTISWTMPTGERRVLDYAASAVHDDHDRPMCYVTVARNVTERSEVDALPAEMARAPGAGSSSPTEPSSRHRGKHDRGVRISLAPDRGTSLRALVGGPSRENGEGRDMAAAARDPYGWLSAIMEVIPDIVFVKDSQGRYLYMNPAGCRVWDRAQEDLLGKGDEAVWPADLVADCKSAELRVLQSGMAQTVEECRTIGGRRIMYLTARIPYLDERGRMVGLIGVSHDITERKVAEEALRESEGQYRTLMESIGDLVYLLSPTGTILSLNPAFESHFGWSREQWIGRSFLDLLHPEDREEVSLALRRALTGLKETLEVRLGTQGGGWLFVECAGGLYRVNGVVVGILGVARDVTKRKRAEQALRENQASLRRITDAIPGFVYQYRVGPDGAQSFPFASRGTKDLLGSEAWELEADANVGWKAVFDEDLEGLKASIAESAANLAPWTHEFRVRSRDGVVRWLRGSSLPERQPDGAIVWYGLFTDVTARRTAEQQLRFTQFAMDHAADAILWAGPDLRLVYANHEACRSLGYTQEELLHLRIADIAPLHDPIQFAQRLAALKQGERAHYESVHRTKDGREFPVEVSIRYLEHEGVGYTCGTMRDITERRSLEQRLRHADRLATLGTITAGVAHELNNPLFVISGHLQLIERNLARRQFKAIRKELLAAQDATLRATGIVNQFLSTAHASTGGTELCDVTVIARKAIALFQNDMRARNIAVETDFPDMAPAVSADPQTLMQVFLNLLSNARQAQESLAGKGRIRISVSVVDAAVVRFVECRMQDNGPGIDPEHLPRIFDPFFTTKPVGEGTGLGLAICHRIVSELSGTITCQSVPGSGATFVIRLPAAKPRLATTRGRKEAYQHS